MATVIDLQQRRAGALPVSRADTPGSVPTFAIWGCAYYLGMLDSLDPGSQDRLLCLDVILRCAGLGASPSPSDPGWERFMAAVSEAQKLGAGQPD